MERNYRVMVGDLEQLLNKTSDLISTKEISDLIFEGQDNVIMKTNDKNGTPMLITNGLSLKDFNMAYKDCYIYLEVK